MPVRLLVTPYNLQEALQAIISLLTTISEFPTTSPQSRATEGDIAVFPTKEDDANIVLADKRKSFAECVSPAPRHVPTKPIMKIGDSILSILLTSFLL